MAGYIQFIEDYSGCLTNGPDCKVDKKRKRNKMKKIDFFDWEIHLQDNLFAVTDFSTKKMVIMEGALELNALIWIDEQNELQIKPTWDCVISINANDRTLTIRHVDIFNKDE